MAFLALNAQSSTISTFDSGTEGWTSVTFSNTDPGAPPHNFGTFLPGWIGTGGDPGGYISIVDPDGNNVTGMTQYWRAPAAFLGNQTAALGGSLSFDLMDTVTGTTYNDEGIILVGGGETIVHALPSNIPGNSWSAYSVPLTPAGWTVSSSSGASATQADLATVLGALAELDIRAEYYTFADTQSLDSVALSDAVTATPEPSSAVLFVLGLLAGAIIALRVGSRKSQPGFNER